jgi:hypothetical protein
VKAHEILAQGLQVLEERGRQRDQPSGERSIPAVVAAFNAITGHQLTAQQGWIFMAMVKLRRSQSGKPDVDHYLDGSNYIALAGEEALAEPRYTLTDQGAIAPSPLLELAHQYARECGSCSGTRLMRNPNGTRSQCVPCEDIWRVIDQAEGRAP